MSVWCRRETSLGVPVVRLAVDFDALAPDAISVLGAPQRDNAALAQAMVRALGTYSPERLAEVSARGLRETHLPGRIELIARAPWVVVDSAHTKASARALAQALQELPARETHLLLSISDGKDLVAILEALLPVSARVTVTCSEPHRSLPAHDLAAEVRAAAPDLDLFVVADPRQAACEARAALGVEDLLCAAGSVYLAGIARSILS